MRTILGFVPFVLFAVIDHFASTSIALTGSAVAALALALRDLVSHRPLKLLEVGAFVMFAGLAAYTSFTHPAWGVLDVRLRVEGGLFVIIAGSLVVRRPFTLQYAKEEAPKSVWNDPRFLQINDRLTAAWTAASAVNLLANFAMVSGAPLWVGTVVTLAAFALAARYTMKTRQAAKAHV